MTEPFNHDKPPSGIFLSILNSEQYWASVLQAISLQLPQLEGTKWISKIWMPAPGVERLVRERLTISWRAPPLTFNNFSTIA